MIQTKTSTKIGSKADVILIGLRSDNKSGFDAFTATSYECESIFKNLKTSTIGIQLLFCSITY